MVINDFFLSTSISTNIHIQRVHVHYNCELQEDAVFMLIKWKPKK